MKRLFTCVAFAIAMVTEYFGADGIYNAHQQTQKVEAVNEAKEQVFNFVENMVNEVTYSTDEELYAEVRKAKDKEFAAKYGMDHYYLQNKENISECESNYGD